MGSRINTQIDNGILKINPQKIVPRQKRNIKCNAITYLPYEAVAEVSKDKESIGRRCGIQLV